MLCLQMALRAGAARVMVSEPVAGKREVAKKLGADVTAAPEDDLEKIGQRLTEGRGFDVVMEASSDLKAARQAIDLAGKCGTVVWVAVYPGAEREAHVRDVLGLPAGLRVLCLVPAGHPAETKAPRTQFDTTRVHYERW